MVARSIAFVKPASIGDDRIEKALGLLDSILWAFKGTEKASWTVVAAPESADVIVVHEHDPNPRIATWRAAGKRIIEFATSQPTSAPLVYPFRAARVIELLNGLDTDTVQSAASAAPGGNSWQFVESLRQLRSSSDGREWLVARENGSPKFWLRSDGGMYAAEAAVIQAIRGGSIDLSRLTIEQDALPGTGPRPNAGAELLWFAAYHASSSLAPWLNVHTRYRVSRWPNFGFIRPLASQMKVAATLASMAAHPDQVAARARVSSVEAIQTLNALSAFGVLVVAHDIVPEVKQKKIESPPIQPRGGFGSFLRNVRKHLGLGT